MWCAGLRVVLRFANPRTMQAEESELMAFRQGGSINLPVYRVDLQTEEEGDVHARLALLTQFSQRGFVLKRCRSFGARGGKGSKPV